jgi:hypothetical protein
MTRTMWLVLFSLAGLGPAIAIKFATPPSLVAEAARDQSKSKREFALNESAKSDRLELPTIYAKTEVVVPAVKTSPPETPSINTETTRKIVGRHWRDANARIMPDNAPLHKKEPKKSAPRKPLDTTAEIWHCRQDAVGGLLRSLDLSPRCNL